MELSPRTPRSTFRAANENLKRIADEVGADAFPAICECDDPKCVEPVFVTRAEYDAIRDGGSLVACGNGASY